MKSVVWAGVLSAILMGHVVHAADAEGFTSLFDGKTLEGWVPRGGRASYVVEEGAIVGRFCPEDQHINTFLCSKKEYENFILKLDFKIMDGNSGLQFRSAGRPFPRDNKLEQIYGYQVEMCVDSDRTGRIYDENGRGYQCGMIFLDTTPTQRLAEAYSTFKKQDWNSLELQCVGPSIKTWINGKKVSDILDDARGKGVFGLQIHCGKSGLAMWRNIRIKELAPSAPWKKFFVNDNGAWRTEGTHYVLPENWSFVNEGGETVLKGVQTKDQKKDGLVISDADYDNFAARVTWRINGGNSALYFRAAEEDVPWTLKGFQNEIAGNEKDGALWHTRGKTSKGRGWVAKNDELGKKARRAQGWNTVSTIAVGDRIVNRLNGFEMFDIVDPLCEKTGKLGLQLHGSSSTTMWFKDFEVQPISPEFVELMKR